MFTRTIAICIFVVSGFMLVGCGSTNAQEEAKSIIDANWSMDTTTAQTIAPSYREGASIPIIKCGDSHYVGVKDKWAREDRIYEFTKLTLSVKPDPVSPADKANGIEWRGEAVAKCELIRAFFCDNPQDLANCTMDDWSDCAPLLLPNYGLVKKSDGTWIMTPGMSDFSCESHPACLPLNCTEVGSLLR